MLRRLAVLCVVVGAALATSSPGLNCAWEISENTYCTEQCTPVCQALNCTAVCSSSECTATPKCEVNCTGVVYDDDNCPMCLQGRCEDLPCEEDCSPVCQLPTCTWDCALPRGQLCASPKLELICPNSTCESSAASLWTGALLCVYAALF